MLEERPWGNYKTIYYTDLFKTKVITVYPGKRLSLQRHQYRAEHWYVLAGEGRATVGSQEIYIQEGATIDIPVYETHRIENIGTTDLIFVEVQTGTYFGEDDIERIEDDYGRA